MPFCFGNAGEDCSVKLGLSGQPHSVRKPEACGIIAWHCTSPLRCIVQRILVQSSRVRCFVCSMVGLTYAEPEVLVVECNDWEEPLYRPFRYLVLLWWEVIG